MPILLPLRREIDSKPYTLKRTIAKPEREKNTKTKNSTILNIQPQGTIHALSEFNTPASHT